MTAFNQAAIEALCSASYLSTCLETMEYLPTDVQRHISHIMQLNINSDELMTALDEEVRQLEEDPVIRRKARRESVAKLLISLQDIKDVQLRFTGEIIDLIEQQARILDGAFDNINPSANTKDTDSVKSDASSKTSRHQHSANTDRDTGDKATIRRKRMKEAPPKEEKVEERGPKRVKVQRKRTSKKPKDESSAADVSVDPEEPVYCLCRQVSYGEMVGCDNNNCPMEWFHFNCVGLACKPKGRWFCPRCRGDRPNTRRSDLK